MIFLSKKKKDFLNRCPSLKVRPRIRTVVPLNRANNFNDWSEYIHKTYLATRNLKIITSSKNF